MNIKFIHEEGFTQDLKEFYSTEWPSANEEVFGFSEQSKWKMEEHIITAREDDAILGVAQYRIIGGVAYLSTLLVKKDHRGKGNIGKALLEQFEKTGIEKQCHKFGLKSYKNSRASKFFEKQGYKVEGTLVNDIHGIDWVMMAKFI